MTEASSPTIDETSAPSQNGASETGSLTPPRPRRMGRIVLPILGVLVIAGAAVGFNIYWQQAHYVSTDNAQVAGQPISVGAMSAGRVMSVRVAVGSSVRNGQLLAQVELPTAVRSFQNGTPDLEFLGSADQHADVISPVDGVVIAVPAAAGATVAQGQALVTIVNPSQLWVTANVDENQMSRLRLGQKAEVHLDALDSTVPGTVSELTPATASVFGLLPQSNTTTNFTKVGQVVPVRVNVDLGNRPALLGSSAEVKIRVA